MSAPDLVMFYLRKMSYLGRKIMNIHQHIRFRVSLFNPIRWISCKQPSRTVLQLFLSSLKQPLIPGM